MGDSWREAPVKYEAIADEIANDLRTGRLLPGDRMPTHRALARMLNVTPGTITRAYKSARERGLVTGEVGRGTFAMAPPESGDTALAIPADIDLEVDLSRNLALASAMPDRLRHGVAVAWREVSPEVTLQRHPAVGSRADRESAQAFVPDIAVGDGGIDHLAITAGAQHALVVALASVTKSGDTIAAAELTYPGLRLAARHLNLRVVTVDLDGGGLTGPSFKRVIEDFDVKALYCMPTLQNPTATIMTTKRRKRIRELAMRRGVAGIEDDTYRFLVADPPAPLVSGMGDLGIHITTTSKALLPGLRIAYVQSTRERYCFSNC